MRVDKRSCRVLTPTRLCDRRHLLARYQPGRGAAFASRVPAWRDVAMGTQEEERALFVHERAALLHPCVESGSCRGMFQCRSFAGTAWVAMLLMYAAGPDTP